MISQFNATRQKAAVPAKGDLGMVMKRAHKKHKHAGKHHKASGAHHIHIHVHHKGTAHVTSEHGFGAADDLHEEKRKHAGKKGKHMKRKAAHEHTKACKHAKHAKKA